MLGPSYAIETQTDPRETWSVDFLQYTESLRLNLLVALCQAECEDVQTVLHNEAAMHFGS